MKMGNILYGDLGSERMIFNYTSISETVISELYRNVKTYSFGYRLVGNIGMWYYVNKYNQRGAGYISCVCNKLPPYDSEHYAEMSSALILFGVNFHTIEEFEESYKDGSYGLVPYQISYPDANHIAEMYEKLMEILPKNGKMIIYMPCVYGREVFISNAVNLLARFFYVLPLGLRNKISFSIGNEKTDDNANISIVESLENIKYGDTVIDCTKESGFRAASESVVEYWTSFFDNDDCIDDDIEEIFEKCVNDDNIVDLYSRSFNIPYGYLYRLRKNMSYSDYASLKEYCRKTVNFDKLGEYFKLEVFYEEERKMEEKKKQEQYQQLLRRQEEEEKMEEEKRKRYEESMNGWLRYLDDYVKYMGERNSPDSSDEEKKREEYEKFIKFFEVFTKIAETKAKEYNKASNDDSSAVNKNNHWSSSNWIVRYNEELVSGNFLDIPVEFSLDYQELLTNEQSRSYNPYSGLLLYLRSIYAVNYIDEKEKYRLESEPRERDAAYGYYVSYNHCCYKRKVSKVVYYDKDGEKKTSVDYEMFLSIASIVCLYVFCEDITRDKSGFDNLNKDKIMKLFSRYFRKDGYINIAFYHCVFLYASILGLFENYNKRKDRVIVSKSEQNIFMENFNIAKAFQNFMNIFDNRVCRKIYDNTMNSFVNEVGRRTENFNLKQQFKQLGL